MKNMTKILNVAILSAGVLLVFAGCNSATEQSTGHGAEANNARTIVLLTWDKYFAPETIESFESESGLSVKQVIYENLGEMTALLRSNPSAYDLVITDDGSIPVLAEMKLISGLNHGHLPNMQNIFPRYLNRPIDPANRFTIPYVWGTTLVAYRTDRIADPKHSWDILWDPALKGRIAMIDERADIYAAALLKGKCSLNSQNPDQLDAATDLLLSQIRELDPHYTDVITARDLMLKDEVWVMITYSCDAAALAAEGENIGYFVPEEGAPIWMDSFAIPRLASNTEGAHAFIDYLCRKEVAAANANRIRYIPPIQGAEALLDEDLVADRGLNPPLNVIEKCESLAPSTIVREQILNKGMKKIFDEIRARKLAWGTVDQPRPAGGATVFVPAEGSPE